MVGPTSTNWGVTPQGSHFDKLGVTPKGSHFDNMPFKTQLKIIEHFTTLKLTCYVRIHQNNKNKVQGDVKQINIKER